MCACACVCVSVCIQMYVYVHVLLQVSACVQGNMCVLECGSQRLNLRVFFQLLSILFNETDSCWTPDQPILPVWPAACPKDPIYTAPEPQSYCQDTMLTWTLFGRCRCGPCSRAYGVKKAFPLSHLLALDLRNSRYKKQTHFMYSKVDIYYSCDKIIQALI